LGQLSADFNLTPGRLPLVNSTPHGTIGGISR
jgi:hypothetical protein